MLKEWKRSRKIFFEKCCKLICKFKLKNKPKYLTDPKYRGKAKKAEDLITYEYVENMKSCAFVKEKISVNGGSFQKKGTDSDALVNPDIIFSTPNNELKTFFECKVLGRESEYISKYISEGIVRFVVERYAHPKMPFYGILGYARDYSAIDEYPRLKKRINKKRTDLKLINQKLLKSSRDETIFRTKHKTIECKCNKRIEIRHILHSWT